ncbi:GNAT family N-acetyltransferase [Streptomyces caeni]|uniref:GNAT family N-acetyltransferase n=1 Tax=Streptomyces caeni TaxID=2307231 RepID=A0ABW4IXW5_9ACTN
MNDESSGSSGKRSGRSVRHRTEGDLEECVRVLAQVHQGDCYPVNWPERPGEWLSHASLLGSWIAELDGRLVGHVSLSRSREGDLAAQLWSERHGVRRELAAVVSRLFVAPQARGHGIGALLMSRAMEEAQRRGLHPVLDVVTADTAAVALYERLGWELMATVEQRWSPHQTVAIHCYAAAP